MSTDALSAETSAGPGRASNLQRLRAAGIGYQAQPGRCQVIIRLTGRTFEFWPSTGRWRERNMVMSHGQAAYHKKARHESTGVDSLIACIGADR